MVTKLLQKGNKRVKASFEELLEGRSICCAIDERLVFGNLGDNEKAVWSPLVVGGYLKILSFDKAEELEEGEEVKYQRALTNHEVKMMFQFMVRTWFLEVEAEYSDFITALLQGDLEAMNEYMNRITMEMFSYFDTGKKSYGSDPERFYHGFVLGLLVELKIRYLITSNRESGFGRYDHCLKPKKEHIPAMIIEFKVLNERREKTLEDIVQSALKQIEEKQYEKELITRGIARERIRKYGFAFWGKGVLIGQ